MKKGISMLLLISLLCSLCPFAFADSLTDSLAEAVPFGVIHAETQSAFAVYQSPNMRNRIDLLNDYQLCAILSAETFGNTLWYEIRYIKNSALKEGYIKGDSFFPLTLAGLIAVTADSAAAETLRTLTSTTEAKAFVALSAIVTPRPTATPKAKITPKPTATPKTKATPKLTATPISGRKKYVLNLKTMKFHLPSCSEVDRITEENRKNTTTTRDSLINQGYTPCQKCNP